MKYILQYVNYNLLAHFLFLTLSYVLILVLYMAQLVQLVSMKETLRRQDTTLPKYKGDFTQV